MASIGDYVINEMNEKRVNKFSFIELNWKIKIE